MSDADESEYVAFEAYSSAVSAPSTGRSTPLSADDVPPAWLRTSEVVRDLHRSFMPGTGGDGVRSSRSIDGKKLAAHHRLHPDVGTASDLAQPGGFRRAHLAVLAEDSEGQAEPRQQQSYRAIPLLDTLRRTGFVHGFVTQVVQELEDGTEVRYQSRAYRRGARPGIVRSYTGESLLTPTPLRFCGFKPRSVPYWVSVSFLLGAILFTEGSFAWMVVDAGKPFLWAVAYPYFWGACAFQIGCYLAFVEVINANLSEDLATGALHPTGSIHRVNSSHALGSSGLEVLKVNYTARSPKGLGGATRRAGAGAVSAARVAAGGGVAAVDASSAFVMQVMPSASATAAHEKTVAPPPPVAPSQRPLPPPPPPRAPLPPLPPAAVPTTGEVAKVPPALSPAPLVDGALILGSASTPSLVISATPPFADDASSESTDTASASSEPPVDPDAEPRESVGAALCAALGAADGADGALSSEGSHGGLPPALAYGVVPPMGERSETCWQFVRRLHWWRYQPQSLLWWGALAQLVGAAFYSVACVAGLPLSGVRGYGPEVRWIFLPSTIGSTGFTFASYIYLLEVAQEPRMPWVPPKDATAREMLGYAVAMSNLIGSAMFLLASLCYFVRIPHEDTWEGAQQGWEELASEWGVRFVYGVGSICFVAGAIFSFPGAPPTRCAAPNGRLRAPSPRGAGCGVCGVRSAGCGVRARAGSLVELKIPRR